MGRAASQCSMESRPEDTSPPQDSSSCAPMLHGSPGASPWDFSWPQDWAAESALITGDWVRLQRHPSSGLLMRLSCPNFGDRDTEDGLEAARTFVLSAAQSPQAHRTGPALSLLEYSLHSPVAFRASHVWRRSTAVPWGALHPSILTQKEGQNATGKVPPTMCTSD